MPRKVNSVTIRLRNADDERAAHHKIADALNAADIGWYRIESNWADEEPNDELQGGGYYCSHAKSSTH